MQTVVWVGQNAIRATTFKVRWIMLDPRNYSYAPHAAALKV